MTLVLSLFEDQMETLCKVLSDSPIKLSISVHCLMLSLKQDFHQHNLNQSGIYGGLIREILYSLITIYRVPLWEYSRDQDVMVCLWNLAVEIKNRHWICYKHRVSCGKITAYVDISEANLSASSVNICMGFQSKQATGIQHQSITDTICHLNSVFFPIILFFFYFSFYFSHNPVSMGV